MTRLPTLGPLVEASARTAQRFPLVLVCGALAAWAGIGLADSAGGNEQYLRLLAAATLGLPLFFALTLLGERRARTAAVRWGGLALGVVALGLFWARWPDWSDPVRAARYFQLSAACHLLVAFVPYAGFSEPNGFWHYNRALLFRFLTAALYTGVL